MRIPLITLGLLAPFALLTAQDTPLIFPIAENAPTPGPTDIPEETIEKVDPSVVSIQHEKAGGTGFIISEDGYILSNGHVVRGSDPEQPMEPARSITVILHDERKYPAQVLGFSMDPDVALLKIQTDFPLRPVEFGDSEAVSVGQRVFAVGTPVGLKRTFTSGILSNTERTDLGTETVVFQTDAAINSGNSGGPLFDQQGRVLGINTYASRGQNNLGFTIPIHVALDMLEDLKTRGRFVRSYIPLYFSSELYEELARSLNVEEGVLVTYVMEGTSAHGMGLRTGDVLIERDGEPYSARTKADLLRLEWEDTIRPAGEVVTYTVLRGLPDNPERLALSAPVEELPPIPQFGKHAGELPEHRYDPLGLGVEKLTDLHHIIHELPIDVEGVFVKTVRDSSVASRAGIQENDIIVQVGDQPVTTLTAFRTALDDALARGDKAIEVQMVRRKLHIISAMAPDYLLRDRQVILIAPASESADVDLIRRELLARGAKVQLATPGAVNIPRPELDAPLNADLDLANVKGDKADVILFTGGTGAKTFWEDPEALRIMRAALEAEDTVVGAIGPAALLPVLAQAELESKLTLPRELSGEAMQRGATYTGKDVESDENLVTTTGRERSVLREFLQELSVTALR